MQNQYSLTLSKALKSLTYLEILRRKRPKVIDDCDGVYIIQSRFLALHLIWNITSCIEFILQLHSTFAVYQKAYFKNANIPSCSEFQQWLPFFLSDIPQTLLQHVVGNINTKIHENHSDSDTSIKHDMDIFTVLQFMKKVLAAEEFQYFHFQTSISESKGEFYEPFILIFRAPWINY